MLPKQHRLPLRTEFNRLKKEGKVFQGRLFGLLIHQFPIPNSQLPPRFAFIVSNKIHKKANRRNRAKRLLREVAREFLSNIKPGTNGVFLAKKPIVGADYQQVKKEVKTLLQKARLIT